MRVCFTSTWTIGANGKNRCCLPRRDSTTTAFFITASRPTVRGEPMFLLPIGQPGRRIETASGPVRDPGNTVLYCIPTMGKIGLCRGNSRGAIPQHNFIEVYPLISIRKRPSTGYLFHLHFPETTHSSSLETCLFCPVPTQVFPEVSGREPWLFSLVVP